MENKQNKVQAQIPQLRKIVGSRKIDVLTLSVGGNDVGFSHIGKGLMLGPVILKTRKNILSDFKKKLKGLPAAYAEIHQKLDQYFSIGKVIITDYPDPTCDDSGKPAAFLKDVQVPLQISASNAAWAQKNIIGPLNEAVGAATQLGKSMGGTSKPPWEPG